jgi:hypothetical protein
MNVSASENIYCVDLDVHNLMKNIEKSVVSFFTTNVRRRDEKM